MLSLKVVKIDSKISHLLCSSKSLTHSVAIVNYKISMILGQIKLIALLPMLKDVFGSYKKKNRRIGDCEKY